MIFRKQRVFAGAALAVLLVALTLLPRTSSAKNSKTAQTTMDILIPTSLGGKPLKAGTYKVIADGSTVTLRLGNKLVAEAPAQWKDGNTKAQYSFIVTDAHGIDEIHFDGKTRYIQVKE